ncbi:Serine/threonine protein kinase [Neorhodopirellula lusitana]|uniref:Serine/threonine protein kinase n=1 Tax=Neorhodopirellula lusitana TaxID=445327 RepID=A0ABY1QBY6_9BACT|nr:protein kinase [Neorhodopirellula lusitana]SMP62241.1 Serine/threonine protein kinase [Neorhodopirellula lusitana]
MALNDSDSAQDDTSDADAAGRHGDSPGPADNADSENQSLVDALSLSDVDDWVNASQVSIGMSLDDSGLIVDRLRKSGQFNDSQLELVAAEIERHFHEDGYSLQDLRIGMPVGEYVLQRKLGEGGAGHVYRACSSSDESEYVALKLIKQRRLTQRFRREMEMVLRLAHPNVVVAYETGEHGDTLYIVMEELSGPDLQAYVSSNGAISWRESLEYIRDAATGLEHAHERGLIHRDVKPGNMMFDAGRIKVTDLGLAILTDDGELLADSDNPDATESRNGETSFRTRQEILGGTPDFMAPEQARSLSSATIQSDIYSLGASWYYMLTGHSRVPGTSVQSKVVNLVCGDQFKPLPDDIAPSEVRAVLDRMLALDAADRYASMSDVLSALQMLESGPEIGMARSCIEVLIVEDDQDDLFLTTEMLQRGNNAVNIFTAHTLQEAIHCGQANDHIDVVLLDLQLPDSHGVDTVRSLHAAMPTTPMIVLTGHEDEAVSEECVAAGADMLLCKGNVTPYVLERLIFVTLSRASRRATV